jgi:hypothetical protein
MTTVQRWTAQHLKPKYWVHITLTSVTACLCRYYTTCGLPSYDTLVCGYQHLRITRCLHLQGWIVRTLPFRVQYSAPSGWEWKCLYDLPKEKPFLFFIPEDVGYVSLQNTWTQLWDYTVSQARRQDLSIRLDSCENLTLFITSITLA